MPKIKNDLREILNKSIMLNVILAIVIVIMGVLLLYQSMNHQAQQTTTTVTNTPNQSQQSNGTLAGINQPLTSAQLSVINDAPLGFYETAGEKLLNGTLQNQIVTAKSPQYNAILVNGKPSVVYIGAISCVFCGENRWAMALALSKFGNFSQLFMGYSALKDGDVPTLYWIQNNYTTASGVGFGNYYSSKYINFYSAEYQSPITQGFQVQPLSYFISKSPNSTYTSVLTFMNSTGKFQGTPFTFWGTSLVTGADAVVFGNSTPSGSTLPISSMTHAQILAQLQSFSDQFAWSEYAGADVYIAQVCPAINDTAAVCSLPAIKRIGAAMGLVS